MGKETEMMLDAFGHENTVALHILLYMALQTDAKKLSILIFRD